MSRIGKAPITLPKGVTAEVQGNRVKIKGPKGELSLDTVGTIAVQQKDGVLTVTRQNDEKKQRALHGLTRALLSNMAHGVAQGYQRTLDIVGVGYRAQKTGRKLVLNVGYTHPVEMEPPSGVEFDVEGQNRVHVKGIDKALVGQIAAKVRKVKPPDPYKGKGIRYAGERVRIKAGKTAAKKK
ncbi:MAG: 50S ribosomal protein L6 [Chloroflexi bacterium]|nr:50S ribosomal protein L6 [Chloroflexota bacterium]